MMKSRLLFCICVLLVFLSCRAYPGKDDLFVNFHEPIVKDLRHHQDLDVSETRYSREIIKDNNEETNPKEPDLLDGLLENEDASISGLETEMIEPEDNKNDVGEVIVITDKPIVSVENLKPVNVVIYENDTKIKYQDTNGNSDKTVEVTNLNSENVLSEDKKNEDHKSSTVQEIDHNDNSNRTKVDLNANVVQESDAPEKKALLEPRVTYEGAQVWSFDLGNNKIIKELVKLNEVREISWWGGNKTAIDFMVRPSSMDAVRDLFEREGVNYDIVIADLQDAIDNENPEDEEEEFNNRKGHRMTWQSYHRIEDIHGFLNYLATTYPNLCSVNTIGSSVHGYPLKVLRVSNGNPTNKAIWIDGGMHAREWISPATVTYIIDKMVDNFETQPEYVKNVDWYFLPVANPDGYEYTHLTDRLWRKNRARAGGQCAGTDLNRNFGYQWGGKGNSKNPCAETYGGSGAFSEPETRAIQSFFQNTGSNFQAYLSFHSYGQYILYPWGYDRVVPPDYQDLENVGQKIAQAIRQTSGVSYKVGSAANTLYPASGGSDDWAKAAVKVKYAYTIELRDSGRYGFILPAQYIIPTAEEAFVGVKVVAEAVQTA